MAARPLDLMTFSKWRSFMEWAKCFEQFGENFEQIVLVSYGFGPNP
jgi:hypothetical protein